MLKGYRTYIAIVAYILIGFAEKYLGLTGAERQAAIDATANLAQYLDYLQVIFTGAVAWYMRKAIKDLKTPPR